jgi:hypothetical protein
VRRYEDNMGDNDFLANDNEPPSRLDDLLRTRAAPMTSAARTTTHTASEV